jgi:hypothetical protein
MPLFSLDGSACIVILLSDRMPDHIVMGAAPPSRAPNALSVSILSAGLEGGGLAKCLEDIHIRPICAAARDPFIFYKPTYAFLNPLPPREPSFDDLG